MFRSAHVLPLKRARAPGAQRRGTLVSAALSSTFSRQRAVWPEHAGAVPVRSDVKSFGSDASSSRGDGRVQPARARSRRTCAQHALALLNSEATTVIMMFATFWSLMADDVRIAAELGMQHDRTFAAVTAVCFFLFVVEIALALCVRPRYHRSVYFPFDVVATGTLLLEVRWMFAPSSDISSQADALAEASQKARLVRVVRLLRLVRLMKLAKIVNVRRGARRVQADESQAAWRDNPSEVGRMLQDTITLQIVVGVLVMMIVFPVLSLQSLKSRIDFEVEAVGQLDRLWRAHVETGAAHSAHEAAARLVLAESSRFLHLAYFQASDGTVLENDAAALPPAIRDAEYELVRAGARCASDGECSTGGFVIKTDLAYEARFGLGLLWFVILLLGAGVVVFGQVTMRYCIAPIEKLFTIVNAFSNDPMKPLESFGEDALDELNELEQSIRKIASLLQVGIGLAGSGTIARVLRSTGDIDPIAMGRKVNSLFGFCDIRQFTDATECLQEEVMTFTNSVGHIVHHAVHDCGGFANKNIGDAFLVAWTGDELSRCMRQADDAARARPLAPSLEQRGGEKWSPTVGDKAMAAFIRLTVCVRGAPHITQIVQHPVLQRRLPGYTVRLGCGLHVGWAIEGALGTQKKIDATYLSPATNVAMSLEGATKQYGNLLLISEQTYRLFSPRVQARVRRIDRVFAAPGAAPFDLYTYDCPTSIAIHPDRAARKASVERVFDFPLAITPEFRAAFDVGLALYLRVRRARRSRARPPPSGIGGQKARRELGRVTREPRPC